MSGRPEPLSSPAHTLTPMTKVLRFTDLIAEGKVSGKRVFIRADLNVPQDDQGNITEDTRIRASVPAIRDALDAGAAVMVTSHLGRPTEGAVQAGRLARAGREAPLANCSAATCRWWRTGSMASNVAAGPGRAARKLPLQQGREEERRRARAEDGEALRHLRERRVRHRAPRRSDHARHREVRAGRVRRPAAGRRTRRARQGARRRRSVRWWRSSPARRCRPS